MKTQEQKLLDWHYHVGVSISGYMPEDSMLQAGIDESELLVNVLSAIHFELGQQIEMQHEEGQAAGDAGDYETGWKTWNFVQELEVMRANAENLYEQWSGKKPRAPLYNEPVNGTQRLRMAIHRFIHDLNTHPLTHDDRLRLHITKCMEEECLEGWYE